MHIRDLTSNYTYQNPTWLSSLTPERCQRRGNTSSVFQVENNAALIPPQPSLFSLPCDFPKPKQFSVLMPFSRHLDQLTKNTCGTCYSVAQTPSQQFLDAHTTFLSGKFFWKASLGILLKYFVWNIQRGEHEQGSCPATHRILNYTSDKMGTKYLLIKQLRLQALHCFDKAQPNKLPFCSFLEMLISGTQTAQASRALADSFLRPGQIPWQLQSLTLKPHQFRSAKPVTGRTQPEAF